MREILFRAKRIDNGEWVEGWYQPPIVGIHCDGRKESLGASLSIIGNYGFLEDVYIIPETVGQFTGLTDKNGTKIFEGDIIKHYNRVDDPTSFDVGRVFWDSTKCRWLRTSQERDYHPEMWSSSAKGYEIIGNIYDNPELIGFKMLICTQPVDEDCPALGSNCKCFPWCEHLKEDGLECVKDGEKKAVD